MFTSPELRIINCSQSLPSGVGYLEFGHLIVLKAGQPTFTNAVNNIV
jgi:hypothetical protein